jgi:hypothetical protein
LPRGSKLGPFRAFCIPGSFLWVLIGAVAPGRALEAHGWGLEAPGVRPRSLPRCGLEAQEARFARHTPGGREGFGVLAAGGAVVEPHPRLAQGVWRPSRGWRGHRAAPPAGPGGLAL